MAPEDIITAHLAKGDDVSSGGRQMPGHYGGAPYNLVSLSRRSARRCCTRWDRHGGMGARHDVVAMTSYGEGTSNQGDPRGHELRRRTSRRSSSL
jgi:2-oxoisovalerate dehydrogenase E1 component alpha subunit